MSRSLICSRHSETHWTRHKEGSPFIPKDETGHWFCTVCHEPPKALLPFLEPFDFDKHFEMLETRAGAVPVYTQGDRLAVTDEESEKAFRRWRGEENGWVKARILTLARLDGEWHASSMVGAPGLEEAVRALSRAALIEKLNARGGLERRGTTYVWRLSATGRPYASHLRRALGNTDRLPGPKEK